MAPLTDSGELLMENVRHIARSGRIVVTMVLVAASAAGATWTGGRTTPNLSEIVAIDETGEPGWLFGTEDLAGDGNIFQQQEQSIDIRTAYASTDAQRLWVRTYVSDTAVPGGNVTVYVFIDSDQSASTGGSAAATNVSPSFTDDPSSGGYEWVVGVRGNESIVGAWQWDGAQFAPANLPPNQTAAEVETDLDPIRIGANDHGYLQLMVDLGALGLDQQCNANLYVRSSNDTAALGAGDLEVGQVASCVPADANDNGIPDPVEPPPGCTSDDQCPGDGVCVNGACVLAVPCVDASDCQPGELCTPDGRCVPEPSGSCTTNEDCGDLVCAGGQCVACTPGGAECGAGRRCAPNGRCISDTGGAAGSGGVEPVPGQEVQGGACTCSLPGGARSGPSLALALLLPIALGARRASRRRRAR